jgi:hypothetical protein
MLVRCLTALVLLATGSSIALAQGTSDPFGTGAPAKPATKASPPASGAPAAGGSNPFGIGGGTAAPAASAPAAATVDPKDREALDQLKQKKVVIKVQVKGRMASLWVGEPFASLSDEDKKSAISVVYRAAVSKGDPKLRIPLPVYASDGMRQGPRLGLYTITAKGDMFKAVKLPPNAALYADLPQAGVPCNLCPPCPCGLGGGGGNVGGGNCF